MSHCAALKIACLGGVLMPALLLPLAPAAAFVAPSAGCTPAPYAGGNLTCTNTGTITTNGVDGIDAPATNGDATTTNGGNINTSAASFGIRTTTDIGNATTNNSGNVNVSGSSNSFGIYTATGFVAVGQAGINTPPLAGGGTATTNNDANVNVIGAFGTGIFTGAGFATVEAPLGTANLAGAVNSATTNNFGNVSVTGFDSVGIRTTTALAVTQAPLSNGGASVSGAAIIGGGDATTINSGNVMVNGNGGGLLAAGGLSALAVSFGTIGIVTEARSGNATTSNAGTVIVVGNTGGTFTCISCGGSTIGISTNAFNGNATVINSGIVSVSGPNNIGISLFSTGNSLLINSGVISAAGGIAIQFANPQDPATLTLQPGSFIVGAINLIGVGDTVNVNAGNQNLTFNTLAGATVFGNVPYIVSGNRIVSIDPTGFATTDRSLMDFTRAVSSTLGGRVSDAAASGGATGPRGALGFAAYDDSVSRFDDAFAQAMGYAKAPSDAVIFKNPTVTAPDGTTVWARGFYGQRTQQADGPVLRNVSRFYGGAIGFDRLTAPDLRLGGFLGGGAISTSIDLNYGGSASDIVFAGGYGRKDFGPAFVDFALLGGHTGNRTTRNVNNNLLANGLEVATASFQGWFVSPEVAAGYRYEFAPGWSVTPTARLRYLAASYDGFTETGSTANLTAGGRTLQNAEERGEVTLSRTIWRDTGRFQVGLTGGVLGQQRTGSGTVNAILLGQALAFATPGKSSIGGGYAGASLDWRMKGGISMFAATEYTAMTDSSHTITGKAGLRYGF